ncbi:MAG: C1 family peptidase [Bacteroidales bacterium]
MKKYILSTLTVLFFLVQLPAQNHKGYQFKDQNILKATPIQNQGETNTCWAFAGISFLESEVLRIKNEEVKLSEMWIVRHAYREKAIRYVRMHGAVAFRAGGIVSDLPAIIEKYGVVTQSAYPGLNYGLTTEHRHGELHAALRLYLAEVIKNSNAILSTAWLNGFEGILDAYLGERPKNFEYRAKEYTPQSFAHYLQLPLKDYRAITSFDLYPQNSWVQFEIPDNWRWDSVFNISLDNYEKTILTALQNGYTVGISLDITDANFMKERGIAVVPAPSIASIKKSDKTGQWEKITLAELRKINATKEVPGPEREISPLIRSRGFANYFITDDHMVHIIGTARDQFGKLYFKIKDSAYRNGVKKNGGYVYISESYLFYKSVAIILHKDAISSDIVKEM